MADTILVPLELPDHEPLSPVLVNDVSSLDIVLLGHYELPEQTPVATGREQFEAKAQAELDEIAESFTKAGASVRTRLVFGKDRQATIDRVAVEEDCAAELDPAPTEEIKRILVPIPDVAEFERLPTFVDILCEDTTDEITITLFHVIEGEENRERGERIVEETRDGMIEAGFDPNAIDVRLSNTGGHDKEIIRVAREYDAVVMYEAEPRLGDRIFGTLPDRIRNETGDPVIVVNRDY
jgi:nucleotide-binding universal stress UspA family protein